MLTVWIVTFGQCSIRHYAEHHAMQLVRALESNGTPCTLTVQQVRRDSLSPWRTYHFGRA
jgi:hypothetical protein